MIHSRLSGISWRCTDDSLTPPSRGGAALTRRKAAVALAILPLAACQKEPGPVRIGFLGGLSGSVAELGVNGRNGALLAVETLNAQGGRLHELLVEDDQQDPDRARAAIASLAERQASFVVGPMTSSVAIAVVPEAERRRLVLISPTATTDDLTGKADIFFRVAADAGTGARQLGELMVQRGVRSVGILMDLRNRSYSASFGRAFANRIKSLGGTVTAELGYEGKGPHDFGELTRSLLAGHPGAALLVAGVGDSALMAQQLRRADPAIGLAISPWAANAQFLQLGGRAVEGCVALQALDLDDTSQAFAAFRKRFRERFGDAPGTPAVQAYEALTVGATALAQAAAAGKTLQQVLSEPGRRWPGLQSDVVLDAYGDTDRPLHMTEVRNAAFITLRP